MTQCISMTCCAQINYAALSPHRLSQHFITCKHNKMPINNKYIYLSCRHTHVYAFIHSCIHVKSLQCRLSGSEWNFGKYNMSILICTICIPFTECIINMNTKARRHTLVCLKQSHPCLSCPLRVCQKAMKVYKIKFSIEAT